MGDTNQDELAVNSETPGTQNPTRRPRNKFPKGNQYARNKGKQKPQQKSRVLLDMLYVYSHPNGPFRSEAQRKLGEQYEFDSDKFIGRLTMLDRAYAARAEKRSETSPKENDEGEERVIELAERWLKERKNGAN